LLDDGITVVQTSAGDAMSMLGGWKYAVIFIIDSVFEIIKLGRRD